MSPEPRKGFGTKMVTRTIESQLMGTIEKNYMRDGLVVTLEIPLSIITQ